MGQVADQHRDAFAEPTRLAPPTVTVVALGVLDMHCRPTSPRGGTVHDVVVDEGEGLQQLERRARVDDAFVADVTAGAGEAPIAERRPQSFAAVEHERAQAAQRLDECVVERAPAFDLGIEHLSEPFLDPFRDEQQARRHRHASRRGRHGRQSVGGSADSVALHDS